MRKCDYRCQFHVGWVFLFFGCMQCDQIWLFVSWPTDKLPSVAQIEIFIHNLLSDLQLVLLFGASTEKTNNLFVIVISYKNMSLITGIFPIIRQLNEVWIKEVSQQTLHPAGLGTPSSRDQCWVEGQVHGLCGTECSRASLGSVETLDGAGQPDESLETLDVSTPVVHQLVFSHSSATAGRRESRKTS